MHNHQKSKYAQSRRNGMPAHKALERSRKFEGQCWSSERVFTKPVVNNQSNKHGHVFVENLASIGLRFVGYADELTRGINHSGWFINEHQDEKMRGVVVQRQGKDGMPVFIHGYECPHNPGFYILALSFRDWITGIHDDDPQIDAAICADSMAEIAAESEREYQQTYAKAQEAREMLGMAKARLFYATARIRMACKHKDFIGVNLLMESAQDALEQWRDERQDAINFIDEWKPTQRWQAHLFSAWVEGYQS